MGTRPTNRGLSGAAAATALTALIITLNDEPASSPGEIPEQAYAAFDYTPQVASATIAAESGSGAVGIYQQQSYHAAPLGETARQPVPTVVSPQLTLAVSSTVNSLIDDGFEQAFELDSDLDLVLTRSGGRSVIDLVRNNQVDLALLGGTLSQRELHAGLRQTRIGVELFALAVSADFPMQSLTQVQVRQVLSGQTRDWQSLGCDRGAIVVIAPSQPDLAERAATSLIRGDNFANDAVRVADERQAADQLLRNRDAIAVVRVGSAVPQGMKLLQIDWTLPTADAYRYGTYRYGVPVHLISNGVASSLGQRLLNFTNSANGSELLNHKLLTVR